MKFETLQSEWAKDTQIDPLDLISESLKVPALHSKYYLIYINEIKILKQYQVEYDKIYNDRWEHVFGDGLDLETLKKRGWEPVGKRITGSGPERQKIIDRVMAADDVLIPYVIKLSMQKEKVEFIKSILNELMFNRKQMLKNATELYMFAGQRG
jgi:hypothetical protein